MAQLTRRLQASDASSRPGPSTPAQIRVLSAAATPVRATDAPYQRERAATDPASPAAALASSSCTTPISARARPAGRGSAVLSSAKRLQAMMSRREKEVAKAQEKMAALEQTLGLTSAHGTSRQ